MPSISCDWLVRRGSTQEMALFSSRSVGGFLFAVWAAGSVACSSGSSGQGLYGDGGTGEGGTGDGGPPTTTVDEPRTDASTGGSCTFPASQALSGPCCTERGADACGAGLFCAAFDGRTQPTCYPEHSRAEGQTCTEDIQCAGNTCDAGGVCKKPTVPPPNKCPATCTAHAECQATCPATSGIACCDTASQICYASSAAKCPGL
jgi:hypothetical protein